MVSSRRISRACTKAKYQGKKRAGCKRSGRCSTNYREGRLRRGGVGQYVQGQGVSHLFVRMFQCCLAGRYVRNIFARGRAQADAPPFVMGARFGEAALASVHEGREHFLVLGKFCHVASED